MIRNIVSPSPLITLLQLKTGYIASGTYDAKIIIWDVNTSSTIRTLTGHSALVRSLVILQNGYLARRYNKNLEFR